MRPVPTVTCKGTVCHGHYDGSTTRQPHGRISVSSSRAMGYDPSRHGDMGLSGLRLWCICPSLKRMDSDIAPS